MTRAYVCMKISENSPGVVGGVGWSGVGEKGEDPGRNLSYILVLLITAVLTV